MDIDSLLAFVRFHAWANDRILTTAADLPDEEFRRETVLDHGSAFQTLRHLVDVDWSWRELCIGNDVVPRWLIVAHVVNHGTQHRSELARYFTECGHSAGDIDLLDALHVEWPGDA